MDATYFISTLLTTYVFKVPKTESTQIEIFASMEKINP